MKTKTQKHGNKQLQKLIKLSSEEDVFKGAENGNMRFLAMLAKMRCLSHEERCDLPTMLLKALAKDRRAEELRRSSEEQEKWDNAKEWLELVILTCVVYLKEERYTPLSVFIEEKFPHYESNKEGFDRLRYACEEVLYLTQLPFFISGNVYCSHNEVLSAVSPRDEQVEDLFKNITIAISFGVTPIDAIHSAVVPPKHPWITMFLCLLSESIEAGEHGSDRMREKIRKVQREKWAQIRKGSEEIFIPNIEKYLEFIFDALDVAEAHNVSLSEIFRFLYASYYQKKSLPRERFFGHLKLLRGNGVSMEESLKLLSKSPSFCEDWKEISRVVNLDCKNLEEVLKAVKLNCEI